MTETRTERVGAQVDAAIDAADALDTQQLAERQAARVAIVEPLRAELERLSQKNQRLADVIRWALGEGVEGDGFPPLPEDWPRRKFYWRGPLRELFEAAQRGADGPEG